MDNQRKLDLDLDAISVSRSIQHNKGECIFYFRVENNQLHTCNSGDVEDMINGFITYMKQVDGIADVISAALSLYMDDDENASISLYNDACMGVISEFESKHDIKFDCWIGDEVGNDALFGEYTIRFFDIKTDIETDMPEHVFFEWFESDDNDYSAWCNDLENNSLYCHYCNSLVHNDKADWNNSQPVCCYCGNNLKL